MATTFEEHEKGEGDMQDMLLVGHELHQQAAGNTELQKVQQTSVVDGMSDHECQQRWDDILQAEEMEADREADVGRLEEYEEELLQHDMEKMAEHDFDEAEEAYWEYQELEAGREADVNTDVNMEEVG